MSANNAIVVLGTVRNFRTNTDGTEYACEPYKVYRVHHVIDWENYRWHKENQLYNLGYFLYYHFSYSSVFENISEAMEHATVLHNLIEFVEHGIIFEDTEYVFPGDL